ncbi:hypothetical protein EIN_420740 [Entamoeba invadens IP1]|uniref:Uncharacterized protein n=1 Tax=Entamoeba invadens IP1 TaxID=370355 RepID=L7FP92_ENTIV|nr:hypothetical protein EIN_420740 [Entamoeba invadens IP1]ELP89737.1 hypothetical protein EIN_420740 [Entamoeba invadens IP1]|eukprot:XP_004256508.1 hypothetical protein EIN_420740 [Entamoeba invadens IP1]
MPILFTLVFLIPMVYSETLSIILVTAPYKRKNTLDRSMRDLYEALHYIPKDLTISKFYFVQGCVTECQFPKLDAYVANFSESFKNINFVKINPHPQDKHGTNISSWPPEVLSTTFHRTGKPDWIFPNYVKHMTLNFFFTDTLRIAIKETQSDYYLFCEDDQSYEKNAFDGVLELMRRKPVKRCFSKICLTRTSAFSKKMRVDPSVKRVWGAFGVLRDKSEALEFLRWIKFNYMSESQDTLGEYMCMTENKFVELNLVSRHFGFDRNV